jgi:alpha-beta hydrolase superfamily lysophospholipase
MGTVPDYSKEEFRWFAMDLILDRHSSRHVIVIAHDMGGILAHTLVADSGALQ